MEQVLLAGREWLLAHLHVDAPALERLMDPDYLQIDTEGATVGKEQVLALFRSDEHHVRVYGDTAVVVGRWRAKGENAGRSFDYQARYVSVWVRRDDSWRMFSDQSTPIAQRAMPQVEA